MFWAFFASEEQRVNPATWTCLKACLWTILNLFIPPLVYSSLSWTDPPCGIYVVFNENEWPDLLLRLLSARSSFLLSRSKNQYREREKKNKKKTARKHTVRSLSKITLLWILCKSRLSLTLQRVPLAAILNWLIRFLKIMPRTVRHVAASVNTLNGNRTDPLCGPAAHESSFKLPLICRLN